LVQKSEIENVVNDLQCRTSLGLLLTMRASAREHDHMDEYGGLCVTFQDSQLAGRSRTSGVLRGTHVEAGLSLQDPLLPSSLRREIAACIPDARDALRLLVVFQFSTSMQPVHLVRVYNLVLLVQYILVAWTAHVPPPKETSVKTSTGTPTGTPTHIQSTSVPLVTMHNALAQLQSAYTPGTYALVKHLPELSPRGESQWVAMCAKAPVLAQTLHDTATSMSAMVIASNNTLHTTKCKPPGETGDSGHMKSGDVCLSDTLPASGETSQRATGTDNIRKTSPEWVLAMDACLQAATDALGSDTLTASLAHASVDPRACLHSGRSGADDNAPVRACAQVLHQDSAVRVRDLDARAAASRQHPLLSRLARPALIGQGLGERVAVVAGLLPALLAGMPAGTTRSGCSTNTAPTREEEVVAQGDAVVFQLWRGRALPDDRSARTHGEDENGCATNYVADDVVLRTRQNTSAWRHARLGFLEGAAIGVRIGCPPAAAQLDFRALHVVYTSSLLWIDANTPQPTRETFARTVKQWCRAHSVPTLVVWAPPAASADQQVALVAMWRSLRLGLVCIALGDGCTPQQQQHQHQQPSLPAENLSPAGVLVKVCSIEMQVMQ
jgi:hypothetical protein